MKICIIKLGAMGDVIRTVPVAKAIKEKFPESEITWITKTNIADILETYEFINQVKKIPFQSEESFDILYNFDIEKDATQLAQSINAGKKLGFFEEDGYAQAFNLGAEYYLNTLFDDEIKKSNRKTYQQIMFETAELNFKTEISQLILPDDAINYAKKFLKEKKISTEKLIGIHAGASSRWPSKVWHKNNQEDFIKKAKSKGYEIILLGGPNEIEKLSEISEKLNIPTNNPNNSNLEFAAIVNECKAIVCSDSFALHIAIALKKPTVALFFVTSTHEVESYDLLTKISAPKLEEFFPEKSDQYDEDLVKSISADEILDKLK